jgi:cation:H+ antiporter
MSFSDLGLATNLAIFVVAGVIVWIAGTRLSRHADALSRATGIGQALIGLVLLAGVTSLPEIAVSVTAAASGNPALAVNNLFGSVAMQVSVLAVIDFVVGRRALTSVLPDPRLLLLGSLNVLLLSLAAAGMVAGDVAFLGIGAWAWAGLAGYILCLRLLSQAEGRRPWVAADLGQRRLPGADADEETESEVSDASGNVPPRLIAAIVLAGLAILIAGYALARTGDAIAEETGLGSSFVGFVLLAVSTSLPEFSTALAAARLGRFTMAISDILGTNLINVALLFLVDAVAAGEPVLNTVDRFSIFGALLGIIVTTLFLVGLAERRDRTVFRLGIDSSAVLITYLGGLAILYGLR